MTRLLRTLTRRLPRTAWRLLDATVHTWLDLGRRDQPGRRAGPR